MIRIGLNYDEKSALMNDYISANNISKVYCFYFKKFKYDYNVDCDIEYIEYDDTEMYKYFYRLLEEINESSLIVIDEMVRTKDRNALKYNCMHHYLNQCGHKIIFEYIPIIDDSEDIMILLNFENKDKYKGKGFDFNYLAEEDIKIKPIHFKLNIEDVGHSDKELISYNKRRDVLFANLGNKDPDTIPRELQLVAGNYKKKIIVDDKLYIARNKRFKKDNVLSYNDDICKCDYTVLDFHYRKLDMNDFLKKSSITEINYVSTGLSIDRILIGDFYEWINRLEEIYAKTSLY
ncbi:MAG: hypothetical protein ACRCX2_33855 [Paraclostridium sp.]